MKAIIQPSSNTNKKWMVIVQDDNTKKTIHFGQKGSLDFSSGKRTQEDKYNYIKRHSVNENHNDPFTAGFWSRWALWNKTTLLQSLKDIEKRFNIKIRTE